jgi:hypothetical protein
MIVSNHALLYKQNKTFGAIDLTTMEDLFPPLKSRTFEKMELIAVADMNNDSRMDLLVNKYDETGVDYEFFQNYLIISPEEGKIKKKDIHILNRHNYHDSHLVDINNDGFLDLIRTIDDQVLINYNCESLQFSKDVNCMDSALIDKLEKEDFGAWKFDSYWNITTFDADGDGDQDILCYGELVVLIENLGSGKFKSHRIGVGPYDLGSLRIEDADLDGDLDILYDSFHGLVLFENENGIFKENAILEICGYTEYCYWIDLDKDGDQDLLIKDECNSLIYWSERTKEGLTKPVIYTVAIKAP